jgi:hypothetical protein
MAIQEAGSGEGLPVEPFKQVDAIDGEGRYVLAINPNVQFKKWNRWISCETVPGERPFWEEQIFEAIKTTKDFSYAALVPEKRKSSKSFEQWREEIGQLIFKDKAYAVSISRGLREQQSVGNLVIADDLFAQGVAIGGALILDLEGKDSKLALTDEFLTWKGLIVVKGQPGEAINNVIVILNQLIQKNQYPLWRDGEAIGDVQ